MYWHKKLPHSALTFRCHQLRSSLDWGVVNRQVCVYGAGFHVFCPCVCA